MPQFDEQSTNARLAELRHREEEALISTLAPRYGYQYTDLYAITIDIEALQLLSEEESRGAEVAVFARQGMLLSVAFRNPNNPHLTDLTKRFEEKGFTVTFYMASLSSLSHAWDRYKDLKKTTAETGGRLDIDSESVKAFARDVRTHFDVAGLLTKIHNERGPEQITKSIEVIVGSGLALGASDIHIEPEPGRVRMRYRLDGVLFDVADLDLNLYKHIVSRFKLLSGLKLNIRDEAQDGRFTIDFGDREVEIRSSIIPGTVGESLVMRLLDPSVSNFQFEKLGLSARLFEVMEEELRRPNGAIITTGPTGSGKTTSLYAFLNLIHTPGVKIITLEDPVEYKLPGIVQTQVEEDYTFSTGLRAILRQDPDVILVGEIRDHDVAETAVHAALTGHLVFSTLHTNSAVGAFPRLIDLGVDPRMIGSAFNIILAQRLARKLCDHCKKSRETTTEEQALIARIMERPVALHTIYEAPGCEVCNMSGYKGRIGIYEGIRVDDAVEAAIINDPRERTILDAAKPQGIPSMQQDGIMKVLAGITSLDEVSRVLDLYNTSS